MNSKNILATQEVAQHTNIKIKAGDSPQETLNFFNNDDLRVRVFLDKYALRDQDGYIVEIIPPQMWRRIAREIASVEKPHLRKIWEDNFYWLLEDFRFVPGGRIMFGAGQSRRSTLLNCYVIPIKEDSIEAIFDWCKEAARTYSFGGGMGVDISILRPKGTPVNNSAIYSTGSVSFMEIFSTTTGTIGQAGRRGALMITISVDHPDVLDFIEIKNDSERKRVQYANISVRVTNEFMNAVLQNKDFVLRYESQKIGRIEKVVKAREIWDKLIKAAHASAEPGVIFWDNIKSQSTTEYNGMEVITTNPCAEIPLEPYGCCCLGNVNLSLFVKNSFTPKASVDWENLEKAMRYAVRFLDDVLDYSAPRHPLKMQTEASLKSRRIGVGFTGLGDMFIRLGLKYDDDKTIEFTDKLFNKIKNFVYDESTNIALEKGVFPAFDAQKHIRSPFIQGLNKNIIAKIKKGGIRNAALLTVPPVGSGSALAGVTSGIEPIFALSYVRKSKSLTQDEFKVYHPIVKEYMDFYKIKDEKDLPDIFITSHQIKPEQRVKMQATIQKHIDHSISSTVNLPKDISLEEVEKIYFYAWKLGCKGITVYREGSREGILLTEQEAKLQKKSQSEYISKVIGPRPRPKVVKGKTYKMKTEMGSTFITINEDEKGLFEVFIHLGRSGSVPMSFAEAMGRLISLALRSSVRPEDIIEALKFIRGSRPVVQEDNEVVFSVPDAIAKVMEKYIKGEQPALIDLNNKENISPNQKVSSNISINGSNDLLYKRDKDFCPQCGGILMFTNGCYMCRDCSYSKCE